MTPTANAQETVAAQKKSTVAGDRPGSEDLQDPVRHLLAPRSAWPSPQQLPANCMRATPRPLASGASTSSRLCTYRRDLCRLHSETDHLTASGCQIA